MKFLTDTCILLYGVCFLLSPVHSWNLVWSDEFDDPEINKSKWMFVNGDGCPSQCGWGNNEKEWYQEENAFIENGMLVIEARRQQNGDREFTSAKMVTKGHGDWKYGKVEVRARLPEGQGIWPAIWMLPTDNVFGNWPSSGEIDIMELIGNKPRTVYMTAHFGENATYKGQLGDSYTSPTGKFSESFHIFSVEWKEDEIVWFVNSSSKLRISKKEVNSDRNFIYPFNERFYMILNVAVGGNWPGYPDSSTQFPQRMEIDYVRVYQ